MSDADIVIKRLKDIDTSMGNHLETLAYIEFLHQVIREWRHALDNALTLADGYHQLAQEREYLKAELDKRKDCEDV